MHLNGLAQAEGNPILACQVNRYILLSLPSYVNHISLDWKVQLHLKMQLPQKKTIIEWKLTYFTDVSFIFPWLSVLFQNEHHKNIIFAVPSQHLYFTR